MQKKFLLKKNWMAFVNLKKAFDRVPREVVWWALRSLGIEEWLVNVIKVLFNDITSNVKKKCNGQRRGRA